MSKTFAGTWGKLKSKEKEVCPTCPTCPDAASTCPDAASICPDATCPTSYELIHYRTHPSMFFAFGALVCIAVAYSMSAARWESRYISLVNYVMTM